MNKIVPIEPIITYGLFRCLPGVFDIEIFYTFRFVSGNCRQTDSLGILAVLSALAGRIRIACSRASSS